MVASTAQCRLDGARAHLRHSGYLLDAHLLQIEEGDAGAFPLVQLYYGAVEGRYLFTIVVCFVCQALYRGSHMLIVEAHIVFHPSKMVLIGRIGNTVEPCAERGKPLIAVQPPPRTDEGLLRKIIAQCLVTTRLDEEVSVHRAQIPLHQLAEGTLVAKQHHTGDKENFFGSRHGEN